VGIFPAESAIVRLIGAVLLEANDEWAIQHRSHGAWNVKSMSPVLR
jgi:putative transposase